ncbi:MAG: hypothetical protein GY711_18150 [bacterium]|nr:hypothetical protein [bacterium]
MKALATSILGLFATGCLTLEEPGPLNGAYHGDFTFLPSPERTQAALVKAVEDPWTWRPIVAGVLLDASQFDDEISERAHRDQPVFGSEDAAHDASRDLLTALRIASIASTVSLEGRDEVLSWSGEKNEDLGGHILSSGMTVLAVEGLSQAIGESSPDGDSQSASPSDSAGEAFTHASWIRQSNRTAGAGAAALALGSAWASVEAGEHRLMDVLTGMAIGNFATVFVNEAFLGEWQQREIQLAVSAVNEEVVLGVSWGF